MDILTDTLAWVRYNKQLQSCLEFCLRSFLFKDMLIVYNKVMIKRHSIQE